MSFNPQPKNEVKLNTVEEIERYFRNSLEDKKNEAIKNDDKEALVRIDRCEDEFLDHIRRIKLAKNTAQRRFEHSGIYDTKDLDAANDEMSKWANESGPETIRISIAEKNLKQKIATSLRNLVNTKWFLNTFPDDLSSFLSEKRSKLKLFHGPTCSGKTEIAQRLAGLRDGFPGLKDCGVEVHYITGIESEVAVRDIVEKTGSMAVILIDEADKFLNPNSPLYTPQAAHKFTNMIITLYERKPLYWVLIGTWDFLREGDTSIDEKISNLYGPEFGTRVDYDWQFPEWTLETLLEAIKASVPNRKVTYDDMALMLMAQYCLKSGGGVRSFDNLESRLMRKLKMKGDSTNIDETLVKECFKEWKFI